MRGTAASHAELFGVTGITPACAGNSYLLDLLFQVLGDHPRVCGEQKDAHSTASFIAGSPPRVRGTDAGAACCRGAARITPACAGNSYFFPTYESIFKDHPRVCGEQSLPPGTKVVI